MRELTYLLGSRSRHTYSILHIAMAYEDRGRGRRRERNDEGKDREARIEDEGIEREDEDREVRSDKGKGK